MEKQILLDQLDNRVKQALAVLISMYPGLLDGSLEDEEVNGMLEITDGLKACFHTIADIQYNNNIEEYRDLIYNIAYKGVDNE